LQDDLADASVRARWLQSIADGEYVTPPCGSCRSSSDLAHAGQVQPAGFPVDNKARIAQDGERLKFSS
jgi:hypothetical protein